MLKFHIQPLKGWVEGAWLFLHGLRPVVIDIEPLQGWVGGAWLIFHGLRPVVIDIQALQAWKTDIIS